MKTKLIIYLMSGVVSCQAEKVEPLPLADRVRQSDVVAIAEVRAVKVPTLNENFEYQAVTCVLTNILKGKPVNNPAEVVLALKLKADPLPDRLLDGKSYLARCLMDK